MKRVKFIILMSMLLCLLVVVPMGFAADSTDGNVTLASDHEDVLSDDCYFDAGSDTEGNGSVDNPYKNLTQDKLKDNSINHFNDGEYDLKGWGSKRNMTIIGHDAQNTVIKYGNGEFTANSYLSLQNVTLVNWAIMGSSDTIITATNVIFKDSEAGSICSFFSNVTVYLKNCTFMNNHANSGAAIYLENGSLEIIDTLFINNYAEMYGGAIYLRESEFVGRNMEIINSTSKMGGAITAVYTGISITNWTARNNLANYSGGAMYALFGTLSLSNSTFINNTAKKDGGALFIDEVNNFIPFNNTFENNTAGAIAGAVYSAISRNLNRTSILNESLLNSFSGNSADIVDDAYECEAINLNYDAQNCILLQSGPYYELVLPDRYDLRDEHMVTPVKDQGSNGNCWAFAALASLESCILKANGGAYDLSEENMKNLMAKYSSLGWQMVTNKGGYDRMAHAYLAGWIGPINDTEDEYIIGEVLSPVLDSIFHIQNILFLQRSNYTDNDLIKRAIISYGAVSTSIRWDSSNIKNTINYYCSQTNQKANHAVTIVGWDDNYSKSNFKTTPPGDGAWIIKNSWGDKSGDKGYYYVSYYDTSLAPLNKPYSTYVFMFNDTLKYDKNYQYDVAGRTDFFVNASNTVWYKTKFNATDNEYLSAVSTYFEKDTDWELAIYVNDVLRHTQSGKSTPSYSTIELDNFIPLEIGDVFEIVFRITVDNEAGVPISEDIIAAGVPINKQLFYENISFISYDGENWTDLYNLSWKYTTHSYASQVACIKAFTILDVINTTLKLSFDANRGYAIKAKVMNQYDRPINGRNLTITLDGVDYNVTIINGEAILDIPLGPGNHNVSAVFSSTGFIPSRDNITFYSPLNTTIHYEIEYSDPIKVTVRVLDQNGVTVKYGNITMDIEGTHYSLNLTNGTVCIEHLFNRSGAHAISIEYNGIYCYNSSSLRDSLDVPLVNTSMILIIDNFNPVNMTVRVSNQYGYAVNHGIITFTVDGHKYNVNVTNGTATWINELDAYELHNVTAVFNQVDYLNSSNRSRQFYVVLIDTYFSSFSFNLYNPLHIEIGVTDRQLNPRDYGTFTFTIEGVPYTVNLVNSKAVITHMFHTFGLQVIEMYYNGFNYYESFYETVNFTINSSIISEDSTKTYNSVYEFKLTGDAGFPLNATECTVKIGSRAYNLTTDENGTARLNIDLSPGKYEIQITNPFTGEMKTQTINVVSRIAENKGITMYYGAGKYYKVRVFDDDGNIAKGVQVTFKINNKQYIKTTDSNGYASIKISQNPGKYTITAEYKGFKVSNKITVKSTIVTKNIKVKKGKTIKFTAKLLNKNGKILKYKKVKFKFRGKTYKVKTNKKGKATLKIKKKYKVGKYTITTSYGKLKVKNTIRIRK